MATLPVAEAFQRAASALAELNIACEEADLPDEKMTELDTMLDRFDDLYVSLVPNPSSPRSGSGSTSTSKEGKRVPNPNDDYITTPTMIRVFEEDDHWAIDGIDGTGNYTEAVWTHYDGVEMKSKEEALSHAVEFGTEHGWIGLPIVDTNGVKQ